jgi:hypothetical protein
MAERTKEEIKAAAISIASSAAGRASGVYSFEISDNRFSLRNKDKEGSDWLVRCGYATVADRVISPDYKPWTQRVLTLTERGWEAVAKLPETEGRVSYATNLPYDISGSGFAARSARETIARYEGSN